jgi:hypothetical protein
LPWWSSQEPNLKEAQLIQSLKRTFFIVGFLAAGLFAMTGSVSAKGYVELRGGLSGWTSQLGHDQPSTNYLFLGPSADLNIGWITEEGWETVLSLGGCIVLTNSGYSIDGNHYDSTPYTNQDLLVRNFSLGISEYLNLELFKGVLTLSPCLEARFARYDDISLKSEYTNSTTDYWTSFLRLGLRARARIDNVLITAQFKYPLFGVLTDKLLNENRNEYDMLFSVSYLMDKFYLSVGYNRYQLIYSNPVRNGEGQQYFSRIMNTGFVAIGFLIK